MVPMGHRAVSAGHLVVFNGVLKVSDVGSDTLGLNPRPQDAELLIKFLSLKGSAGSPLPASNPSPETSPSQKSK